MSLDFQNNYLNSESGVWKSLIVAIYHAVHIMHRLKYPLKHPSNIHP